MMKINKIMSAPIKPILNRQPDVFIDAHEGISEGKRVTEKLV